MRLGLVTQWFPPETGSAALPGVIATALERRGHEVHVLTGLPNYPTGRLHPGYTMRPYLLERWGDSVVHRSPLYLSHDGNARRRMMNYLSFAAAASAVGVRRLPRLDAILVHGTPATAAVPAMAMRAFRRVPFVLQVQDLWPDTVISSGFLDDRYANILRRVIQAFCDVSYRSAAAIAVTSPSMAIAIRARGIPASKVSFVPNWADEVAFHPAQPDPFLAAELRITRPVVAMYAGNFGEFQILESVIDAADLLRARSDLQFVLVGGGVRESSLRMEVERRGLDNVLFVPPQPFDRMAAVLALGHVQLVTLQDLPLFSATIPSKIQASLASGRPIVAALTGDAARVIEASGAGEVVPPGDGRALARAIARLADGGPEVQESLSRAARQHYLHHFSEATTVTKLEDLLSQAAHQGAHR